MPLPEMEMYVIKSAASWLRNRDIKWTYFWRVLTIWNYSAKGRRSKLSDEPSIILHDQDGKREQLKWMDRAPIIVSCCHSIVYSLSSSGGGGGVALGCARGGSRRASPWQSHSEPAQRIVFKRFVAKSWLWMREEAFFLKLGQLGRFAE